MCEQPRILPVCTMQLRSDQIRCRVGYGNPRGGALHGPLLEMGTQGHRACHLPQETPSKTFGPTPEGSGPSADGDFMAKGKKLVVEEENQLCLLRGSSKRPKLNLPGLIFRDAPGTSQQKAKREAVPCIFGKKCLHDPVPIILHFKDLKHSQEPRRVNAGTASRFHAPASELRLLQAQDGGIKTSPRLAACSVQR